MKTGKCEHMGKPQFFKILIGYKDENIPAKMSYQICRECNTKRVLVKDILMK